MSQPMLTPALLDLMEHEKVIEQGLGTFIDVGWALLHIRDGRKYRAAGFDTFEQYCRDRWRMGRAYANRLVAAAETVELLAPNGAKPESEAQVRALAPMRDEPARLAAAWERAVEDADGRQPTAAQVTEAVKTVRAPMSKPDLGDGVSHPARFSDALLPVLADALRGRRCVLDPFAGTGRIHDVADRIGIDSVGIELEPEWANLHPRTQVGNALALPFDNDSFDAVCTSPTYGNRLADHHNAKDASLRRSYTHDLGHPLHPDNAGALQWGDEYRTFHLNAWAEVLRVLEPGGRFVLNISDHIRDGQRMPVSAWHLNAIMWFEYFDLCDIVPVRTTRMRMGENADERPEIEYVFVFDKVEGP